MRRYADSGLTGLEQSAEAHWAVGATGFLTVIIEAAFAPRADVKSGYCNDINKSGTAELVINFRLLV